MQVFFYNNVEKASVFKAFWLSVEVFRRLRRRHQTLKKHTKRHSEFYRVSFVFNFFINCDSLS